MSTELYENRSRFPKVLQWCPSAFTKKNYKKPSFKMIQTKSPLPHSINVDMLGIAKSGFSIILNTNSSYVFGKKFRRLWPKQNSISLQCINICSRTVGSHKFKFSMIARVVIQRFPLIHAFILFLSAASGLPEHFAKTLKWNFAKQFSIPPSNRSEVRPAFDFSYLVRYQKKFLPPKYYDIGYQIHEDSAS